MVRAFVLAIIAATLITANTTSATDGLGKKGGRQKQIHSEDIIETMKMVREVMVILKDLNHYPSAEQKKKLDDMIKKTDEMIGKM